MDSVTFTLGPWHDDRTTLTATGPDSATVLAAGLAGLLAASRGETGESGEADATTALAIRAEGANADALFTGLAAALFDEVDHEEYDVRAVRFDGMVRTDAGLAGWGYALAVPGPGIGLTIAVQDVVVTNQGGVVTLRAVLKRVSS
jgi:hypothetical protein